MGLCEQCNQLCGDRYDLAYAEFSRSVRSMTGRTAQRLSLDRSRPPAVPAVFFAPGLVARCVLFGMFAINQRLRLLFPGLAKDLRELGHHDPASIRWPDRLELRVGLTVGRHAGRGLLSSGVWMMRVLEHRQRHSSFGDIVFPPLTWCLVPTPLVGETEQLGPEISQSLANASDWVHYGDTRTRVDLRSLTDVFLPMAHPALGRDETWIELMKVDGTHEDSLILYGRGIGAS